MTHKAKSVNYPAGGTTCKAERPLGWGSAHEVALTDESRSVHDSCSNGHNSRYFARNGFRWILTEIVAPICGFHRQTELILPK